MVAQRFERLQPRPCRNLPLRRKFHVPCAILLGTLPESAGLTRTARSARTRGSCVSPSVHREPALRRQRGGIARASVERRRANTGRAAGRSGNRAAARVRVRRLRRSRCRRRSDSPIQPAAVQGPAAGRQRGAPARGTRAGRPSAARRLLRSTAGWPPPGPGGPRPGGFAPRPGGFAPRPDAGGDGGARAAQPQLRPGRAPQEQAQAPAQGQRPRSRGPIKERPVGRLYDADEDWRAQDEEVDVDNVATAAKEDELPAKDDELDDEQE